MSSATSSVASAYHGARFFVSISATSLTYDANGVAGPSTLANVVVRDMGKTIRTPSSTGVGSVTRQMILRKVAIDNSYSTVLPAGGVVTDFIGFSEGGEVPSNNRSVFYINLYDGNWVSVGF